MCKLQTSIYRSKQASQSWNMYFDKMIRTYDFVRNGEESCIYKWTNGYIIIFLILCVDNIFLIKNDISALQRIKIWLSSQFSIKYLGEASYILEIKIYKDRYKRLLGLSQSTYIDTILKWFNIKNFKKGYLPIGHRISLSKKDCLTTPQER